MNDDTSKAPERPTGRPKGGFNRRASKLRATERKLLAMGQDAVQKIQDSLDGKEVDDKVLATAKWVLNTTVTVTKAALAEEQIVNAELAKLRGANVSEDEDEDDDENLGGMATFSLTVAK